MRLKQGYLLVFGHDNLTGRSPARATYEADTHCIGLVGALAPSRGRPEQDSQSRAIQCKPAFLKVEPGDSVTFVPRTSLTTVSRSQRPFPREPKAGMARSTRKLQSLSMSRASYGYKCLPHAGMGMVGLSQVGEPGSPDPAIAAGLPEGCVQLEVRGGGWWRPRPQSALRTPASIRFRGRPAPDALPCGIPESRPCLPGGTSLPFVRRKVVARGVPGRIACRT